MKAMLSYPRPRRVKSRNETKTNVMRKQTMHQKPPPTRSFRVAPFLVIACALAVTSPAVSQSANPNDARLSDSINHPQEWATIGGTYDEDRFSTLKKINVDTVKDLKLAWY